MTLGVEALEEDFEALVISVVLPQLCEGFQKVVKINNGTVQ